MLAGHEGEPGEEHKCACDSHPFGLVIGVGEDATCAVYNSEEYYWVEDEVVGGVVADMVGVVLLFHEVKVGNNWKRRFLPSRSTRAHDDRSGF